MSLSIRQMRKQIKLARMHALKRFERHRRANLLASPGHFEFIIVLDHLKPAFNIGKIFRSADALGAHEIQLVGIDFFDPAPAMGSFKWVPARFYDNFTQSHHDLSSRGYKIFALDPSASQRLEDVEFADKSAFVFGHEEFGLSFDPGEFPGIEQIRISQFGKVQSLNVSIAASIVMYEYVRQRIRSQEPPDPA